MTPLYTVADTRAIERAMFATMPSFALMQQAGTAVAAAAKAMLTDKTTPVLAVAGGGNNGGDAAIAASALRQEGYNVRLLFAGNADSLPADAASALQQWQDGGKTLTLDTVSECGGDTFTLPPAGLLIDGIFGIGLSRPPQGKWRQLILAMNRHPAPVLAIDTPSGLAADSGSIVEVAVTAAKTITFFGGKPGLYTGDGVEVCGEVDIAPLNAPPQTASGLLMASAPPLQRLRRRGNSHKGSYSTLALIGGASGMLGALVLAARAAASMGAGKTIAGAMEHCPPVDWLRPDIMWRQAAALPLAIADCIAAGMGMGETAAAQQQIEKLLPLEKPLLLDADGLTLLAANADSWRRQVASRQAATLLTPHPGEAARLQAQTTAAINNDRLAAAAQLSEQWQATVVLKGAGTVIQTPGKPFIICAAGNPGLARGGSGDVLSGIIAALLAQTMDAEFAASAGVWLHAAAADQLAAAHGQLALDVNQLAATAAQLAAVD